MAKGMFKSQKTLQELQKEIWRKKNPMVLLCDTTKEILYSGLPVNEETIQQEIKFYVQKKLDLTREERVALELGCDLFGERIQCKKFSFIVIKNG